MLKSIWARVRRRVPVDPMEGIDCHTVGLLDAHLSGWYQLEAGVLTDGFQIGRADTVLDVGCGGGGASLFAARQAAEVLAADIRPDVIEKVRRELLSSPARGFEAVVTDSSPLPFANHRATRVIALEVLEHVRDPDDFMRELYRVGRPGALYLFSVPDPASESLQQDLAPEAYWRPPNHVRVFSHEDFAALVERAGLQIVRRTRYGFFWSIWWALFWAAQHDLEEPEGPMLQHWTRAWYLLLKSRGGHEIKERLDRCLPKSQVIVARKPD